MRVPIPWPTNSRTIEKPLRSTHSCTDEETSPRRCPERTLSIALSSETRVTSSNFASSGRIAPTGTDVYKRQASLIPTSPLPNTFHCHGGRAPESDSQPTHTTFSTIQTSRIPLRTWRTANLDKSRTPPRRQPAPLARSWARTRRREFYNSCLLYTSRCV